MTIFKKCIKYYCLFIGICALSFLVGFIYIKIESGGVAGTMGAVFEYDKGLQVYSNIRILLVAIFSVIFLKMINKTNLELQDKIETKQIVIPHAINIIVCLMFMIFPIIKLIESDYLGYLFKREIVIDIVFIIANILSCVLCVKKTINNTNITTFKVLFSFFIALLAFIGFFREVAISFIPNTEYVSYIDEKVMGNDLVANIVELILFLVLLISYAVLAKKRISRSASKDSISKRGIKIVTIVFAIELCGYCLWSFGSPIIKNIHAITVLRNGIEYSKDVAEKSISTLSSNDNRNITKAEKKEMINGYEIVISRSEQQEQMVESYIYTLLYQITYFVVSIAVSIFFLICFRKILNAFCGG